MKSLSLPFLLASALLLSARAQAQDWPEIPRVLPAPGVEVPSAVLDPIRARLSALEARFVPLRNVRFAADVAVLLKAVRYAVDIGEFYDAVKDPAKTLPLLDMAEERMAELGKEERPPWLRQRGRVARGFYSKIDGSPQPYVLEVPEDWEFTTIDPSGKPSSWPPPRANFLVWLHGRGEKETDLHFITGRLAKAGEFHPARTIVVHPFGRQCIGWKSAGETDVLEVADHVWKGEEMWSSQPVLAGFSMGGAGAWHIGAHYPGEWAAVHAGAGFAETARFMRLKPENFPSAIEQSLWGVYDVPGYVRNLFSLPVLAYSGEIDPQKAAADIMEEAFKAEGKALPRVIGQGMGHKYDPASIGEVTSFFDRVFDASFHSKPTPIEKAEAHIQTKTLRYASTGRHGEIKATITGLKTHWQDSRLDIAVELQEGSSIPMINVHTRNVNSFSMELAAPMPDPFAPPPDPFPLVPRPSPVAAPVTVDGMLVAQALTPEFILLDGKWQRGAPDATALRKRPGQQGPVDDAFMDPFLVVLPEKPCANLQVEKWVQYELKHFQRRWREVFRGELRQKKASEVTPEDMKQYHLVAWGDAEANPLIAKALATGKVPLAWKDGSVTVSGKPGQPAATTVPVMIYPNPLAPDKYLVLNTGPTFRENHDRNNSLQNPKLPDWALLDITAPPDAEKAGKIIEAGFFDESWK